jgi:hypothetical protein
VVVFVFVLVLVVVVVLVFDAVAILRDRRAAKDESPLSSTPHPMLVVDPRRGVPRPACLPDETGAGRLR